MSELPRTGLRSGRLLSVMIFTRLPYVASNGGGTVVR
jgi:hypothetical protein